MLKLLFYHFQLNKLAAVFTVVEQPISIHPYKNIETIPLISLLY